MVFYLIILSEWLSIDVSDVIKSLLIIVLLSTSLFVCYYLLCIFKYSYNGFICVFLQSLTRVRMFVTSQTAARQASVSFTISWSLLKVKSTELMMLSNHLILCHPLLLLPSIFPSIRVSFPMSQFFASGGQSTGAPASASVNIQGWFPLGLSSLISLLSKGLSRVFSSTTVWNINSSALSLLYGP